MQMLAGDSGAFETCFSIKFHQGNGCIIVTCTTLTKNSCSVTHQLCPTLGECCVITSDMTIPVHFPYEYYVMQLGAFGFCNNSN